MNLCDWRWCPCSKTLTAEYKGWRLEVCKSGRLWAYRADYSDDHVSRGLFGAVPTVEAAKVAVIEGVDWELRPIIENTIGPSID